MFEADKESTTPKRRGDTGRPDVSPPSNPTDPSELLMPPLLRLMSGLAADADPAAVDLFRDPRNGGSYSREILTGEAGACLAASRLLAWGYPTQPAMAGSPYDLGIDLLDGRHVRVQVKTTSAPTSGAYRWPMKRGFYRSAAGTFKYRQGDFDIAALVALSISRVFFQAAPLERCSITPATLLVAEIEHASWREALKVWETSTPDKAIASLGNGPSFARRRTQARR